MPAREGESGLRSPFVTMKISSSGARAFCVWGIPAYRLIAVADYQKIVRNVPGFPTGGLNEGSTLITRNLNLVIFRVA
jgi:hypothetical protein